MGAGNYTPGDGPSLRCRPGVCERAASVNHCSQRFRDFAGNVIDAMTTLKHEARRLMFAGGIECATAGHRVGYESPSQFSREYRRLFGAPPRIEIARLREIGIEA
jgi:AraC-like DNA-binding protein